MVSGAAVVIQGHLIQYPVVHGPLLSNPFSTTAAQSSFNSVIAATRPSLIAWTCACVSGSLLHVPAEAQWEYAGREGTTTRLSS